MFLFNIKYNSLAFSFEYHCLFLKLNQTTIDATEVNATAIDIEFSII